MPFLAIDPASAFVVLLLAGFVPPLLFAMLLRNAERHRREPWRAVLNAFAWGGTIAVFLAVAAELLLSSWFTGYDPVFGLVPLSVVVLAPLAEETAKSLGLFLIPDPDPEPEDGLVYGGAVGLGFAATENVLYVGVAYLIDGADVALATAVYRGFVTVALHGAASAIAGYGIWRARHFGRDGAALGGVLLAMLVHAAYNWIVSEGSGAAALAAGVAAVVLFFAGVRRRVKALDRRGQGFQAWPPLPPP
ncbi:MAG TPA: PrsW family intramembrane metalloprotease [Candidatus Thermoplasmatota archaeon]|nr:PrsW family intramembrane metalloprotease [Candidatus Thermoplasmatota archaeon]